MASGKFSIFGYSLVKSDEQKKQEAALKSIAAPENEINDSDAVVAGGPLGGVSYEIDASTDSDGQIINRYRSMLVHPEVDSAVADIVNESIVFNEDRTPVGIELADVNVSDSIKDKIGKEFEKVLDLLNFSHEGDDIFKRWYVDGRIAYHVVIDKKNPQEGILDLRRLDPRRLKKITKIIKEEDEETKAEIVKGTESYYTYDQSLAGGSSRGNTVVNSATSAMAAPSMGFRNIVIAKDAIIHATSGLVDAKNNRVIGHLHKAIRPLNQLKMMEDSLVIYRFSRAPERRVFYVDVGSLPKQKAEQYVKNLMNKYKQKMIYDAETGNIRTEAAHTTMLEDFWLPRREGGRGTEVSTLAGGDSLSSIDDIEYFQKKLYKSLNVPESRLEPDTGFALGRASEITRDEVKFNKFIDRLRVRFSEMFLQCLRVQLVLKKVITLSDWKKIKNQIRFKFSEDSFFTQLKEIEILQERLRAVDAAKEYVGVYYTHEYIQKSLLGRTDQEIADIREQIDKEKNDPFYAPDETDDNTSDSGFNSFR